MLLGWKRVLAGLFSAAARRFGASPGPHTGGPSPLPARHQAAAAWGGGDARVWGGGSPGPAAGPAPRPP